MGNELYSTPEGFVLAKPLLMPGARSFDEVLEFVCEWDYATMNSPRRSDLVPSPVLIDGNQVGPFCAFFGGKSAAVVARPATVEALRGQFVTNDDRISFQVVIHKMTGRALIVAQHSVIIGSRYLAYVDVATLPFTDGE